MQGEVASTRRDDSGQEVLGSSTDDFKASTSERSPAAHTPPVDHGSPEDEPAKPQGPPAEASSPRQSSQPPPRRGTRTSSRRLVEAEEKEAEAGKEVPEFQDDPTDADYAPSQFLIFPPCLSACVSAWDRVCICIHVVFTEIPFRSVTERSCISTRRSRAKRSAQHSLLQGKRLATSLLLELK